MDQNIWTYTVTSTCCDPKEQHHQVDVVYKGAAKQTNGHQKTTSDNWRADGKAVTNNTTKWTCNEILIVYVNFYKEFLWIMNKEQYADGTTSVTLVSNC